MIEEERIDPRYWLEKSFKDSYPLAASRTQTVNGNCKSKMRSPLDVLIEMDVINPDQYRAGRLIIKTRQAIGNNLKTDQILHEYLGGDAEVNTVGPGMLLTIILRDLKPYQSHMIDRVCLQRQRQDWGYSDRPLTKNDEKWIEQCCGTLKESLDHVKKNIDSFLDSVKN